jgi:pimeloyl-ACP methyl ester carboxylesterase
VLHLLARSPDRFRRVVLTRPAPLTGGERVPGFAAALRSGAAAVVEAYARRELPPDLGREGEIALRLRVRALLSVPALADVAEQLAAHSPRPDPAALARTSARVLLVAQPDDAAHPIAAAEEWAALIPGAELAVVTGTPRVRRDRVRELVSGWLADSADRPKAE